MELEPLVQQYGYFALIVVMIAEGEAGLISAAVLASTGLLQLELVLPIAWITTIGTDAFNFRLGRVQGRRVIERRPKWQAQVQKVDAYIRRYPTAFLFFYRFLIGLRIVSAITIGLGRTPTWQFFAYTASAGVVWTLLYGLGGYYFGETLQRAFAHLGEVPWYVYLLGLLSLVALVYLGHRFCLFCLRRF